MIEELKTFICVVECNNFTKAGEKVGLSQPSVSIHVKRLEDHFKTILVQRSVKQKRIYITQQGKVLYEKAKRIIMMLEETEEELRGYEDGIRGTLRIGCSFTLGEYFIPRFLGVFRESHREVDLKITIENTSRICEKVENYELDLGLVEGTVDAGKFECESFYEDRMVLVASKRNPISRLSLVESREPFEEQTWIGREEGSGTKEYFDFFLSSNKINPRNIIVLGSNYAIKETVKNNLGVAFISSLVVEEEVKSGTVSVIPTARDYRREFSSIYPKGGKPFRAVSVFLDMLKDYSENY